MNHRIAGRKLGRSLAQRNGLRRTLLSQVIEHERIETTDAKARFIRGDLEKLITLAKHGLQAKAAGGVNSQARYVHAQRLAAARLTDGKLVKKLFDTIAPRYEKRPGGYTRILKVGVRHGDAAPMVLFELVAE